MSYLKAFEHDIFISYAHREIEKELSVGGRTWTRQVVDLLRTLIEDNLGIEGTEETLDIYQDIYGHEKDRDVADILKDVADTGILIIFVTRAFMRSKWFVDEANSFVSRHPPRWKNDPGKTGIFLIEVEETPRDKWPEVLKDSRGNPLIALTLHDRKDPAAPSRTLGFPNIANSDDSGVVCDRLAGLAVQIGASLESLREDDTASTEPPVPSSEKAARVYLGYTPKESKTERKELARLLEDKGIGICPDKPLSAFSNVDNLRNQIKKGLSQCRLAVQLLADNDGTNALTTMQIDLAKEAKIPLLLWRPESLGIADLDEDAFGYTAYRERFKDLMQRAEKGSIESFSESILEHLNPQTDDGELVIEPWPVDWPTVLVFSGNTLGYRFVRDELEPRLDEVVDESEWKVVYPGAEINSPIELKRFYEENIALCDAVIVVRCEADDSAVRGALTEERHTIKRTLEELGREFKYRTPERDFYVGVVYGPPPGLKIEFGKSAHVFDCSTRQADKDLYRWLEQVRKRVTTPPADRTP